MTAEPDRIDVRDRAAVGAARRVARSRALTAGFTELAADEIALVTTELGTNLLKHADGGQLTIELVESDGRRGLAVQSEDIGPGFHDVERAFADGVSTAGSLGYGLGTVHRLMDEVDIGPAAFEEGTRVRCVRWLRAAHGRIGSEPIAFGAAAKPRPGSAVNGDAYLIKRWNAAALVAVIDGLGHGQYALRAAQTARDYLDRHYDAPLDRLFAGANRACRGTRGVVMAVARIDLGEGVIDFGSVGNIEAKLSGSTERRGLLATRGVVGLNASPPVVRRHRWDSESVLVLHTDGLRTRWSWDDFPELPELTAARSAGRLFNRLATHTDDAALVVVKGSEPRAAAASSPAGGTPRE